MKSLMFLLLSIPSAAFASDWKVVSHSTDGSQTSIDLQSIQRRDYLVQVWVNIDNSRVRNSTTKNSRELWKYNCPARTLFVSQLIIYRKSGKIVAPRPRVESVYFYENVVPDTAGETVMNSVCIRNDPLDYGHAPNQ